MSRYLLLLCVNFLGISPAQEFSIQIAGPVAAQNYQVKSSAFVFRTTGCAEPAKPVVTAKAEGKVSGERRSIPLKVAQVPTPGVYAVFRQWPAEGTWIVNITGYCGSASTAALVATSAKGFVRESSKFFPRSATESEIESALKQTPQN
jgi:hypothetical protein